MNNIAIIGAGDLGQLICHYVQQSSDNNIVGFFDDTKSSSEKVLDLPILGKIQDIRKIHSTGLFDSLVVGVGYSHLNFREELFNSLKADIPFATYIHPSVIFDKSCAFGSGSVILPGCIFDRNVKIGNNIFINIGCSISHDSEVGDHSFFGPGVTVAGFCNVGTKNFIGVGTIIKDNIQTHSLTSTGAGAVLCHSTTVSGTYIGVPAKLKNS